MKIRRIRGFIVLAVFSSALAFAGDSAPPADRAAQSETELKRNPWWAGFFMAGVGAGVTQGTHTPQEWGDGAAGFGRRFASALGKHWINHGIQFGVAKLAHEELGQAGSVQSPLQRDLSPARPKVHPPKTLVLRPTRSLPPASFLLQTESAPDPPARLARSRAICQADAPRELG